VARTEDPTARAQRLIPLATVGALAFATALAFGRVFAGRAPTLELILAGLMAVAIGWATTRRGLLAATLASVGGLALALTWLVFPQTAWYGLPSVRTLRAIGRSLEFVGQQTRTQVSPSPPLPPLMLAAVTAVWAASSSAYTLAVRAGSPILAVLPPVALVAFADIVLEDGVRPVYAATFLLAALAVVFTDGLRRIRQWGPVWSGTYRDHTLRSAAGRGVRRVTLVALGVALLVPGLLPGFRSDPLVDLSGSGGGIGDDPFVSIHASLNREEAVEQFRVTTTNGAASYWRLLTLDHFDGSTWTMTDPDLGGAQTYPLPATLPAQIPESAEPLDQEITIEGYADRWVPMAYPAATVDFPADAMEYDETIGTARVPDAMHAGETYHVTSYRVLPTPRELDLVIFEPASEYGDLTFLPDDIRDQLDEIALDWTADQPTAYREVLAIQQALKADPFEYDKTVEPEPGADAMLEFLTERHTGFCQQFATAMAALVRSRGYPARIGYGYKEGDNPGSTFVVDSHDLHTWVEVLFPGYGWLAFDPTPGLSPSPLIQEGTYLDTTAAAKTPPPDEPRTTGPTGPDSPIGPSGGLPPKIAGFERVSRTSTGGTVDLPPFVPRAGSGVPEEPGYSIPYGLLLTIVLVALGVLLVLVPIVKAAWRYRALHRRREPREAVLAAYRVFDGEAADLGLGRSSGETLAEYRDRIASTVRFSDGHLATLTGAAMRAAYAPESPDPDEAREAAKAAHTAIRDMRRSTGLVRRVTGIYRPGV
jgi:transglutaminase-like putative cysteine protease